MLYLDAEGIRHLFPHGRETLRAPWDADLDPAEAIVDAVASLGVAPVMVHSTSWRVVRGQVVLTFLVVIERPASVPDVCEVELVTRAELARGHATGPPPEVHLSQIVEHGLRHLAWLLERTTRSTTRCPRGRVALAPYAPEPFRAFATTRCSLLHGSALGRSARIAMASSAKRPLRSRSAISFIGSSMCSKNDL